MTTTLESVSAEFADCINRTAPEDSAGSHFAVGTPAMRGNVITFSEARRISEETFVQWTRRLLPVEGDLLIAREAPVGPVVRIPSGEKIAAGQRTTHIRPDPDKVDPRFLYYYLIAPETQRRLEALSIGSTVQHLRVGDVRDFELANLPAANKQRAIGEILGALDDKIAANRRVQRSIDDLLDASFRKASQFATERVELGSLIALNYGKSLPASKRVDGPFPVVGSGGIVGYHDKPLVDGPAVVVGRKGSVGSTYWITEGSYPIDTTYWVTPRAISLGYAYRLLQSINFVAMNTDSAVPGLNRDRAYALQVPLPDEEQLEQFDHLSEAITLKHSAIQKETAALTRTRDELLPLLMSGQITVKDAERAVEGVL